MGFRYTAVGALMNEDKFDDAAKLLVERLVQVEVDRAKAAGEIVQAQTNKAAVARMPDIGVNYRTMSRWVATLKDRGFDVEKQAIVRLTGMAKQQKRERAAA